MRSLTVHQRGYLLLRSCRENRLGYARMQRELAESAHAYMVRDLTKVFSRMNSRTCA